MEELVLSAKARAKWAVPLLAVAALSFLSIGKTVDDLRRSLAKAFRNRAEILVAWRTEHSGEAEVLPHRVQDALALLRQYRVPEYAYSLAWGTPGHPTQRLVEGAFPARPGPTGAPFFLGVKGESLPEACKLVEEKGEVFLARCT